MLLYIRNNIVAYMDRERHQHFPVKDKLHTDVLEEKYGPIHADILRHDNVQESEPDAECVREARLVDVNNTLRTYALTFLTYDRNNEELSLIDGEIRAGGLIGQTFRSHGYTIKKNVIDVFLLTIPHWMQTDFGVPAEKAKARLTEFYAKKENATPVIYGTVLEVYSPDFRDPSNGINDVDRAQVNPQTDALQNASIPTDEIWSRLDKAAETNEWDDVKDKYERAKQLSEPAVQLLHTKIDAYLANR